MTQSYNDQCSPWKMSLLTPLPYDFKTQSYVSRFQMHSAPLALSTLGSLHGGQQAENIVLRVTLLLVEPPVNTAFV